MLENEVARLPVRCGCIACLCGYSATATIFVQPSACPAPSRVVKLQYANNPLIYIHNSIHRSTITDVICSLGTAKRGGPVTILDVTLEPEVPVEGANLSVVAYYNSSMGIFTFTSLLSI